MSNERIAESVKAPIPFINYFLLVTFITTPKITVKFPLISTFFIYSYA